MPPARTPLELRLVPEAWPTALADIEGPQLVVAGPGTGKSEFLVRRATHLLDECDVPGHALLVLTFSRRSAAELKQRITTGTRRPVAGLSASTFHSFALRFLELHAPSALGWGELPAILTGPEQVALVSELLRQSPPSSWPVPFRELLSTRTLAGEVTDFILRARERLIDSVELARLAEDRDDWRALPRFMVAYDEALRTRGRIDYGTLQSTAVALLDDPAIRQAAGLQYRYVLVDEYQDTTLAQATLLQRLTEGHRAITVAADPYQSIYSFRGAELSNVAEFPQRFVDREGAPARRIVLATSFRVPAEILEAAERITTTGTLPGAAGPVEPAPHAGRVDLCVFDQQSEEADWIATELQRAHLEDGVAYRDMAVVVRTKRQALKELSRALERRDIPHDQPDARLTEHPATQIVFDLVRAATTLDPVEATPTVRRLLLGPLFALTIGTVRQLERDRIIDDLRWPEMLGRELEDGTPLADLLNDAAWTGQRAIDGFWHAWASLPQFAALVHDPAAGEYRAAWASLSQTLTRLAERDPSTSLAEYVALADEEDFEASPLLAYRDTSEDHVTLTTLHQAKGLEFEIVVIADAVEGVLPDLRQRQSLLQTEQLSPTAGEEPPVLRRLNEEMRLVYTAMTRARRRVVWTATTAGIDEAHQRPSRFLAAVAGEALDIEPPPSRHRRPITARQAEAWMRGVLTDPSTSPARRLAAARVLAVNQHPSMRPAGEFALVRERGTDRGLVPSDVAFSPSQADAYASCPRRYALERRLRIGDAPSSYMEFGLMIHRVLELTEMTARAEERRSTLEEALDNLDGEFGDRDFGTGSWRAAWRRRAETLLAQLYEEWPHPDAIPRLLEHPLSLEIEGTQWRGVADRIEQGADGSLRVVDYKTSKSPPPKKEAASSIQLGFYLLAAAHDDDVGAWGPVAHAEYWHPLASAPTRRVTPFDPRNLDGVRDTLAQIADGIRSEDWTPKPSDGCRTCSVKLVCPAWPEGQEAFAR